MSKKEAIMEHTNQGLGVFQFYILKPFQIGKAFNSPLREDKNPSFNIFKDNQTGLYLYKDFATDESGNAIDFVMKLKGLDFISAGDLIAGDLGVSVPKHQTPQHERKPIDVGIKDVLDDFEANYWRNYGVSEGVLSQYGVFSSTKSTINNPVFIYQFEWGYKVYQPSNKQRFYYRGTFPETYIFGWEQLPSKGLYLFLCAGEKDTLTLAARGYCAICLNSESADIPKELVKKLERRFRYIMFCYDVDDAGLKATYKHTNTHSNLIPIKLPLDGSRINKDVADYFRSGATKSQFDQLIRDAIKNKYESTLHELSDCRFDFHRIVDEPVPILSIQGEKILTLGNISVVAGKAKSGKSALCQSIISGAITRSNASKNCLGVEVIPAPKGKAVLHFDTEQSSFDYTRKLRNSIYDAGYSDNVEGFESFHLLEFSPWERLRYILHMIDYYSIKYHGVYLVVLDGVADLVKSVNDEESANKVVDDLHQVATELNCGILVVLHLNPDGGKTRGHLGSQLDRKAETVLLVEKEDENTCVINPKYCRNASFANIPMPQYQWSHDLKKFVFLGEKSPESRLDKRMAECEDVLDTAVKRSKTWGRSLLRKFIKEHLGIGRSAAYDRINFMIEKTLLKELKNGDLEIIL